MIDRELMEWAANCAASGPDDVPDVDVTALLDTCLALEPKVTARLMDPERDPVNVLAATMATFFCMGVACGRAEVIDPEEAR